jgi:hypothetical protein
MPPDTSTEITKVWVAFINQYLSNSATLDEFKRDNIELVSRDPQKAEETVRTFITRSQ